MGVVLKVRCTDCGKTWRCFMGNGFAHAQKEGIIAAFLPKEQEDVAKYLAAGEIPAYDFQYRLSVCGHCHNVVSVPSVGLTSEDVPYVGLCPLCGERTGEPCRTGEEESWAEEKSCPVCGSKKLQAEVDGYWD